MALLRTLFLSVLLVIGILLIFLGQRMTGYPGLGLLLLGLVLLLFDLYLYNRRYSN